jgi:hypothetical protein
MTTQLLDRDRRVLGGLLYLLALLLVVGPISEWLVIVWPIHVDIAQARFGAIGLLGERLAVPVVGLFTAMLAATLFGQRLVQGILATLSFIASPALAVLAIEMALDGIQLRNTVRSDVLRGFDRSLARTVLLLLYAAVVAAVLGWAVWKARGQKPHVRNEPAPLVGGGRFGRGTGA